MSRTKEIRYPTGSKSKHYLVPSNFIRTHFCKLHTIGIIPIRIVNGMNNIEQIEEVKDLFIGRLITLSGSVLSLIGYLIIVIVDYKVYINLLNSSS